MPGSSKFPPAYLWVLGCTVLFAVLLSSCNGGAGPSGEAGSEPAFDGESTELEQTIIVPAFESPLEEGRNVVWCSSFQVAWDKLSDVIGEPVKMQESPQAVELLNSSRAKEEDLHPDSYYANAGFVREGIIDTLTQDMADKFPDVELPDFEPDWQIIAYAYLKLAIKFPHPYVIEEGGLSFTDSAGKETEVRGFGVEEDDRGAEDIRGQIEVLFYNDEKEFEYAVDLHKESSPYQLVLARVQPRESLAATYDYIRERDREFIGKRDRRFVKWDWLLVPEIWWRIAHEFTDVENKLLLNDGFTDYWIDAAKQMIYFKLDNEGVELESEAYTGAKMAGKPRKFLFNRPFFIYLKKRDAETPVFAMWVDNAELLVKF